jgi:hypothetical protein
VDALACKAVPVRCDLETIEIAMIDPTDADNLERLELATGMKVVPLVAPESSIETMLEKCYPLDLSDDSTLSVRKKATSRNMPNDPVFWDLVSELETGDLDQRLSRIEENLDRMWVLLEKVLRTLESREGAHRLDR